MSISFNELKDKNKFTFPSKPLYPSNKPAYFYDGQLQGDMAHFYATSQNYWGDQQEVFEDVPF